MNSTTVRALCMIVALAGAPSSSLADQADQAAIKHGGSTQKDLDDYAAFGRQMTDLLGQFGYSVTVDMLVLTGPVLFNWSVTYNNDLTAVFMTNPRRIAVYYLLASDDADCIDLSTGSRKKVSRDDC